MRNTNTSSGADAGRFVSHAAAGKTSCAPYATYSSDSYGSAKAMGERTEEYNIGLHNNFHEGANKTRGNCGPDHTPYYEGKAKGGHGGSYDNATHQSKTNR